MALRLSPAAELTALQHRQHTGDLRTTGFVTQTAIFPPSIFNREKKKTPNSNCLDTAHEQVRVQSTPTVCPTNLHQTNSPCSDSDSMSPELRVGACAAGTGKLPRQAALPALMVTLRRCSSSNAQPGTCLDKQGC